MFWFGFFFCSLFLVFNCFLCFLFSVFFLCVVESTETQPHELEDPVVRGKAGYFAPPEEVLPPGHGHPGEHHHGDRLGDRRQVLCPHEILRRGEAIKRNVVMMAARASRGEAGTRGIGARRGAGWVGVGVGLNSPARPLDACTATQQVCFVFCTSQLVSLLCGRRRYVFLVLFWADILRRGVGVLACFRFLGFWHRLRAAWCRPGGSCCRPARVSLALPAAPLETRSLRIICISFDNEIFYVRTWCEVCHLVGGKCSIRFVIGPRPIRGCTARIPMEC